MALWCVSAWRLSDGSTSPLHWDESAVDVHGCWLAGVPWSSYGTAVVVTLDGATAVHLQGLRGWMLMSCMSQLHSNPTDAPSWHALEGCCVELPRQVATFFTDLQLTGC